MKGIREILFNAYAFDFALQAAHMACLDGMASLALSERVPWLLGLGADKNIFKVRLLMGFERAVPSTIPLFRESVHSHWL